MKLLLVTITLLAGVRPCVAQDDLLALLSPSTWVQITEQNEEWVVYHPCFAGVRTVSISTTDKGTWRLVAFYGQDADEYEILGAAITREAEALTLRNTYSKEVKQVFFVVDPQDERFSTWRGLFYDNARFVRSEHVRELPQTYEEDGDCGEP
ncbi:MAG: hypothetical protein KDC45_10220 [Bacteroidetes bacterium]|nr:hypothetical protein [Bacteroidota bacterium]